MEMIEIVKKYGTTGTLVLWLLQLQLEVSSLKNDYKDCMDQKVDLLRTSTLIKEQTLFIIPDEKNYTRYARAKRSV